MKTLKTEFGMQRKRPEVFDLSKEFDETHATYGLDRDLTQGFAWLCLMSAV